MCADKIQQGRTRPQGGTVIKVIWSLGRLQRKLHVTWRTASSAVNQLLSCMMGNVGSRFWKEEECVE